MPSHLADPSLLDASVGPEAPTGERHALRDILASFERRLIVTVLVAAGGNQKRAAKALGVLPTTLQEKLKRFGIANRRRERRVRGGERMPALDDSIRPRLEAHETPQEDVHK